MELKEIKHLTGHYVFSKNQTIWLYMTEIKTKRRSKSDIKRTWSSQLICGPPHYGVLSGGLMTLHWRHIEVGSVVLEDQGLSNHVLYCAKVYRCRHTSCHLSMLYIIKVYIQYRNKDYKNISMKQTSEWHSSVGTFIDHKMVKYRTVSKADCCESLSDSEASFCTSELFLKLWC